MTAVSARPLGSRRANGGETSPTIKFPMSKAFTTQARTVAFLAPKGRHYLISRRASSGTASLISIYRQVAHAAGTECVEMRIVFESFRTLLKFSGLDPIE